MSERIFYARTVENNQDRSTWQILEDHLQGTAKLAGEFCHGCIWKKWAYTAGMWHDLGKYSDAFQKRLQGNGQRVVHSTAGANAAMSVFGGITSNGSFIANILAYTIAGHHAGLPDGNSSSDACLNTRMRLDPGFPAACPEELLKDPGISHTDLSSLLTGCKNDSAFSFRLSFFIRMLFSCVVDADRLNSEAFANPEKSDIRKQYPTITLLNNRFFKEMKTLSSKNPAREINRIRNTILAQSLDASDNPPGLFSLTVPTGGGKTLSSLAFALKHALKHTLERIIYVIPYTSIIEQNAKVFREFLGDNAVIEHHSNFQPPENKEEVDAHSLAIENWDAPLIVTTGVQFFESLFSHKTSRCRKLHNIMNSVVILDEAQMLPPDLLRPCMEAIRELTGHYNASVVLCTATQPALNVADGFKEGFEDVHEIIENPRHLYNTLKRVDIHTEGRMEHEELAETMIRHDQVLCIVNTRNRARHLFDLMAGTEGTYHLSALMCPLHRTQVLDEIRNRLDKHLPCRVVSTQLIEAGVDIDFPVVYRELAGVDSIAQAAGRCNREGRQACGDVFVFESPDGLPTLFRQQAQAAQTAIRHHGNDVLSLDGIRDYFSEVYWKKGEDGLDRLGILNMLARGASNANFPFREIGDKFRFIADNTMPVLIPWKKDGQKLLESLRKEKPNRELLRKAQQYTVSLYRGAFNKLHSAGVIENLHEFIPVLTNESLYNKRVGLMLENPYYRDPESNVK